MLPAGLLGDRYGHERVIPPIHRQRLFRRPRPPHGSGRRRAIAEERLDDVRATVRRARRLRHRGRTPAALRRLVSDDVDGGASDTFSASSPALRPRHAGRARRKRTAPVRAFERAVAVAQGTWSRGSERPKRHPTYTRCVPAEKRTRESCPSGVCRSCLPSGRSMGDCMESLETRSVSVFLRVGADRRRAHRHRDRLLGVHRRECPGRAWGAGGLLGRLDPTRLAHGVGRRLPLRVGPLLPAVPREPKPSWLKPHDRRRYGPVGERCWDRSQQRVFPGNRSHPRSRMLRVHSRQRQHRPSPAGRGGPFR